MKTTITDRGQVSIPAALRREMRLEAGQVVSWEKISATECRFIVQAREKIIPDPIGALNFAKEHGLETMGTDDWLRLLREGEED